VRIGLIAGFVGVSVGAILAFIAAYYGGIVDTIVQRVIEFILTIPNLMVLIIIAMSLRTALTVDQMALIIASLAWLSPTRTVRSQVLTIKERGYVQVARLSGMNSVEIIAKELMPNLLPYLVGTFVTSISAAVLAAIGLLGFLGATAFGLTWADPIGALVIAAIMAREGRSSISEPTDS